MAEEATMLMSQGGGRQAKLRYFANGFRLLAPGDHVVCAISGERIPLETLRYWSVARQEAYASATFAMKAATSG